MEHIGEMTFPFVREFGVARAPFATPVRHFSVAARRIVSGGQDFGRDGDEAMEVVSAGSQNQPGMGG